MAGYLDAILRNPNFSRWFSGSKVTNPVTGVPKEVFHGTPSPGFTSMDPYASSFGLFGPGTYFTDNPSIASGYAGKAGGSNGGIIPGFLNIKNPMQMEETLHSSKWRSAFKDAQEYFESGVNNEEQFKNLCEGMDDGGGHLLRDKETGEQVRITPEDFVRLGMNVAGVR